MPIRFRAQSQALTLFLALVAAGCGRRASPTRGDGAELAASSSHSSSPVAAEVLAAAEGGAGFRLVRVARDFWQATDMQFVPRRGRLAVLLQKTGQARVVTLGGPERRVPQAHVARPLFEVAVRSEGEFGLLGLTFHPDFASNGLFYVNYNPKDGRPRTRIAEWQIPPERVGSESAREARVLLEVDQPYENHNAGQLAFGRDGMLYFGLGDGGGQGDPHGNGQNLGVLLGKLLRIDPAPGPAGLAYSIPTDNPFLGRAGARPEIWAWGLRNPWRFTFDARGRVVLGDVGQFAWEEIDVVERGENLGWNVREGRHCHRPPTDCVSAGMTDPVTEYARAAGQSVTGGYFASGPACPRLRGRYVFGDFVQGRLWSAQLPADRRFTEPELHGKWPKMWSTFGKDAQGDLYVVDYGSGDAYRVECEGGRVAP